MSPYIDAIELIDEKRRMKPREREKRTISAIRAVVFILLGHVAHDDRVSILVRLVECRGRSTQSNRF